MVYKENIKLHAMALSTKKIEYNINDNGCWICTSHIGDKDGYPKVARNKKSLRMSRYIYTQENGEIPKGLMIRHKCDNPKCINPHHLETGTNLENMKDKMERGRDTYGERNGACKLTEDQVRLIIADTRKYREIAKDYPITFGMVGYIKKRKKWKHLIINNSETIGMDKQDIRLSKDVPLDNKGSDLC